MNAASLMEEQAITEQSLKTFMQCTEVIQESKCLGM